ncbi:hypothetical protein SAMN05518872_102492 [Psychrobacillus sp. OK032]|nr:hypothetical protein SAMN05518872_102492 [Psychrobacillus sp. OK032]
MKFLLKQIRCNHGWKTVDTLPYTFGCVKCGKVKKVWSGDISAWKFKRKYKGDTFR